MPQAKHGETNQSQTRAWESGTLRDPHRQPDKAARVEAMFDAIAPTYERFNTLATFGCDARWRRRAVAAAEVRPGDVVVDICCGTGDMIRALARAQPAARLIIGVDFSGGMLGRAAWNGGRTPVQLLRADALRLPLADASADVVSCAFGVRNFGDLQAGLNEMSRICRPGARLVLLEFARPDGRTLRWLYRSYCNGWLPRLGRLLSRDPVGAYQYLPRSIDTFEPTANMLARLRAAGLHATLLRMNFGGVVICRAHKARG